MIRYALICADCETEFDAWFRSSKSYDEQASAKQVTCIACNSTRVTKQIMAPSVRTTKAKDQPAQLKPADMIAAARDHIAKTHDYVGDQFPDEARAMHYGEIDNRPIWGEANAEDREALQEEGIGAVPLPDPLVPPKPKDKSKLN